MAVATQAVVSVGATYTSICSATTAAGVLISPEGEIEIAIAASQPAATLPGHPLGLGANPYFFPLGTGLQIWAISVTGAVVNVTVTF